MEGKVSISHKNVDNLDKESYDMSYTISGSSDEQTLKDIKDKIDVMLAKDYNTLVSLSDNGKEMMKVKVAQ